MPHCNKKKEQSDFLISKGGKETQSSGIAWKL
jgi:hypothetical protein